MSRFREHLSQCPHGIDAGAYVLKALSPDERHGYAEHLSTCDHCRVEVDQLRLVVDSLPMSVPQAAPPEALKSRIMSVVSAESELLLAAGPEADRVSAAAKPRRRWLPAGWGSPLRPAFAGALACALLAVGVVGGVVFTGDDGPATRRFQASVPGPGEGRLAVTGGKAALELTRMPSPPAGRVYQVWFDRGDGQLRPTHTLFNVRSDGRARVGIDESVNGVKRILVTAEPTGGSLAPSADPVITASPA